MEFMPDGDEGLRAPKGPVSDEANPVELSDGSLYATYRTSTAIIATPTAATVAIPGHRRLMPRIPPDGRISNIHAPLISSRNSPTASFCSGITITAENAYLTAKWDYYSNRNPAWVTGGIEKNGISTGPNRKSCSTTWIPRPV